MQSRHAWSLVKIKFDPLDLDQRPCDLHLWFLVKILNNFASYRRNKIFKSREMNEFASCFHNQLFTSKLKVMWFVWLTRYESWPMWPRHKFTNILFDSDQLCLVITKYLQFFCKACQMSKFQHQFVHRLSKIYAYTRFVLAKSYIIGIVVLLWRSEVKICHKWPGFGNAHRFHYVTIYSKVPSFYMKYC